MKRLLFFVAIVLITSNAGAQTVAVAARTQKVVNENADGYSTELDAKAEDVQIALGKFMKESGKTKTNGDLIVVSEPVIDATVYEKGFLYATAYGSELKTRVWIGINKSQWSNEEAETVLKEIEQMVSRFGIKYYRDQIQKQIDEAQQAADAVTRQAQRTQNDGKQLQSRLVSNGQEKVRLEKAIEENKLEGLVLKQKIVNNKKSLDSLAMVREKIKKVIEAHKEKQGKVN